MDKDEARKLLKAKLAAYRKRSYAQLVANIGADEYLAVKSAVGTEYQIEIQCMWDDMQDGAVRVIGGIDDGSLSGAFRPVSEDFILNPDGSFVGE